MRQIKQPTSPKEVLKGWVVTRIDLTLKKVRQKDIIFLIHL